MSEKIKKGLKIFYSQFDKESPNFDYVEKRFDSYLDALIKDGKEIPLLWWRSIRTISALIDMVRAEDYKMYLRNLCTYMAYFSLCRKLGNAECLREHKASADSRKFR